MEREQVPVWVGMEEVEIGVIIRFFYRLVCFFPFYTSLLPASCLSLSWFSSIHFTFLSHVIPLLLSLLLFFFSRSISADLSSGVNILTAVRQPEKSSQAWVMGCRVCVCVLCVCRCVFVRACAYSTEPHFYSTGVSVTIFKKKIFLNPLNSYLQFLFLHCELHLCFPCAFVLILCRYSKSIQFLFFQTKQHSINEYAERKKS